ncbi:translation initiation factor IF-3 [Candidatus Berkelbacteria bacterium]|nr:translation initiation factor IF-3 [Candidatus Berkelbacteria bacterium]
MVIDENGNNLGKVSREQAFFLAQDANLDLVEVGSNANPPVVKLMDFGKHKYEEEKRARKHKAQQKSGEVKEIKLSFRIGEHDINTKVKRAERFIKKGDRIKLFMRLIGRENAFAEDAKQKMIDFAERLGAEIESLDRQGNRITAILK